MLTPEEHKDIFSYIKSHENDAPYESNDNNLWQTLQLELEMMVWSVVNDGIVTDAEEMMLLSVLIQYGVPNNSNTQQMLGYYLSQEVAKYQHHHQGLSVDEKAIHLEEENRIKAEIEARLKIDAAKKLEAQKTKEQEAARHKKQGGAGLTSILAAILSEKHKKEIDNTIDSLVQSMGLQKKAQKDGSFVAQFSQQQFQKNQTGFGR